MRGFSAAFLPTTIFPFITLITINIIFIIIPIEIFIFTLFCVVRIFNFFVFLMAWLWPFSLLFVDAVVVVVAAVEVAFLLLLNMLLLVLLLLLYFLKGSFEYYTFRSKFLSYWIIVFFYQVLLPFWINYFLNQ